MMSSFQDNRLAGLILAMPATPAGLTEVATALIEAEERELTEEVTGPFVEELFRVVLDWMAGGDQEDIRALLANLRSAIYRRELIAQARRTPERLRLFYHLEVAGQFLATFLRSTNLARDLGVVTGSRRRTWRHAMLTLLAEDRPLMRRDLVARGVFENDKTAHSALQRLVSADLIVRVPRDGNVLYDLSWTGRSVARAMRGGGEVDVRQEVDRPRIAVTRESATDDGIEFPVGRLGNLLPFRNRRVPDAELPSEADLWKDSHTFRFAAENGGRELAGDYLLSAAAALDEPTRTDFLKCQQQVGNPVFYPRWQADVAADVHDFMRAAVERVGGTYHKPAPLQTQPHLYPYIESEIRQARLALPWELMFGDGERAGRIDVVPLAQVRAFRVVFVRESAVAQRLGWEGDSQLDDAIERLHAAEARICTPLDTAAQHHVWSAVTFWKARAAVAAYSAASVDDLLGWLRRHSDTGVVVCDTGIALKMRERAAKRKSLRDRIGLVRSAYPRPIAAGVAFARSDELWGRALAAFVSASMSSTDADVRRSWELTRVACETLDMTWGPTTTPELVEDDDAEQHEARA